MLDRLCAPGCVAVQRYLCGFRRLRPVVAGFLADSEPGFIDSSDLDDAQSRSEQTETEQEPKPFTVWVSSVGVSR